jgi:hypothetical protein
MGRFSKDADVLRVDSAVFAEAMGLPVLCKGDGGVIAGTRFTAGGANFTAAGVAAGQVIWLRSGDGRVDGAYEITARVSATELTVSVIRGDDEAAAVGPGDATAVSYRVATLEAKGQDAAYFLTQYFGIRPGFADAECGQEQIIADDPLRPAEVYGILADVYSGRAVAVGGTAEWDKAEYYRRMYERARERCRLWLDGDEDGQGDTVIDGGTARMRRE